MFNIFFKKFFFMFQQDCHFNWKPVKTWKNLELDKLKKKPENIRNFEQKSPKNLEFLTMLLC